VNARYVVLRHETPPGYPRPLHWDFMLEDNGSLLTWALEAEPVAGGVILAEQLAAHRLAYLDFEGEVSGRGKVTQFDAGRFNWLARRGDFISVELSGGKLAGRATLQLASDRWQIAFAQ